MKQWTPESIKVEIDKYNKYIEQVHAKWTTVKMIQIEARKYHTREKWKAASLDSYTAATHSPEGLDAYTNHMI